jgi:hypothetical protein
VPLEIGTFFWAETLYGAVFGHEFLTLILIIVRDRLSEGLSVGARVDSCSWHSVIIKDYKHSQFYFVELKLA